MHAKHLMAAVLLCAGTGAGAAPVTSLPPLPGTTTPAPVSHVATPVSPVTESHFNLAHLEQIQSETLLLEAQAAKAKAERAALGGGESDTTPPAMATGTTGTLPRITEIAGAGRLAATLVMPDNSQVQVTAGQAIAGTGLTVTQVTPQQVTVRRTDGTTLSLPMDD